MALRILVALAAAAAAQPVDPTPYCCTMNDCEVMTGDACPDGFTGPMPESQCISECMKREASADLMNVTLAECNAEDKYQAWSGETLEKGVRGSDVRNEGARACLEAISVDPVQVATCLPNPGSAGFTFNTTIAVDGGMMHNGYCLETAASDVKLALCDASNEAQRFAFDAKTGRISQGASCLTLV